MNKRFSSSMVCVTGAITVLLASSCASTGTSKQESGAREDAKRHERALKLYQEGHYAQAEKNWQSLHRDALFGDDPSRTALAAYHLGLVSWRRQQYETAYRHFLAAEQFQKQAGKVQPELILMLAQADWAAHQKPDRLRAVVETFIDNRSLPADLRVQALLIAASNAPDITAEVLSRELALQRAETLYSKLQSPSLKRHLQHVLSADAAQSGQWSSASAYLTEAIEQARLGKEMEWMALHTYELGRVYGKLNQPKRFAEQAVLSAGMWKSLDKAKAASLVLQNSREAVLASGDPDLQELAAGLQQQAARRPQAETGRGDLDSILLSVLDASP